MQSITVLVYSYVFSADYWALDNQSSVDRASRIPRYPQLLIVLCVWLKLCGLSPQFGMVVGAILARLMWSQSCWWDFMGVTSDITRKQNLMANSLILWFWQCFGPVSLQYSLGLKCRSLLQMSPLELDSATLHFDLQFSCDNFCLLERCVSERGVKTPVMCGCTNVCRWLLGITLI